MIVLLEEGAVVPESISRLVVAFNATNEEDEKGRENCIKVICNNIKSIFSRDEKVEAKRIIGCFTDRGRGLLEDEFDNMMEKGKNVSELLEYVLDFENVKT